MVVSPKVELVITDPVIGIGVGDPARHRAVPRLPDRQHARDRGVGGLRAVGGGTKVFGHRRHRLAIPMPLGLIGLVGARPGRDEADVDRGIARLEQRREAADIADIFGGIAGPFTVERAIFLQHDDVPRAVETLAPLVIMKAQRLAALRFQADAIVEPRLLGEQLEQRGHAAVTRIVEVGDRPRAPVARRRMRALGEAVADEKDRFRRRLGLGRRRGSFTMRGGAGDRLAGRAPCQHQQHRSRHGLQGSSGSKPRSSLHCISHQNFTVAPT